MVEALIAVSVVLGIPADRGSTGRVSAGLVYANVVLMIAQASFACVGGDWRAIGNAIGVPVTCVCIVWSYHRTAARGVGGLA